MENISGPMPFCPGETQLSVNIEPLSIDEGFILSGGPVPRSSVMAVDLGSKLVGDLSFGHQRPLVSDSPGVGVRLKMPRKEIRKLDKPVLMIVGEDVGLNDIVLMHAMTLVGQFSGRKFNSVGVKNWVTATWMDHVNLCPKVFLLPRGWIAFKFVSEADAAMVLAGV